jgi:predicted metal-binding protein
MEKKIRIEEKTYIAIVQCDIVKQRCSGYFCEKSFNERSGGFSQYPKEKSFRTIYMTCGGCFGRAVHAKLSNLIDRLKKYEKIGKERILVHLSSCITKENYHGFPCPHREYLEGLIEKLGLDFLEDTYISNKAEERRKAGIYGL